MELRKELARVTGLPDLPATLIFDYPSIAELTAALLALVPGPAAAVAVKQPAALPQPSTQREQVAARVMAAVRTALGSDASAQAALMSAGLDSLGAVELRKELASALSLDLPSTLVFDYPSAEAITDLILGQLAPPKRRPSRRPADDSAAELDTPVITVPQLEDDDDDDDNGAPPRPRLRRSPPLNPTAPLLTKEHYFTVPPMQKLRRLSDDGLRVRMCVLAVHAGAEHC